MAKSELSARELTADEIASVDGLRHESWRATRPSQEARLLNAGYFESPPGLALYYGVVLTGSVVGAGRLSIHRSLADVPEAQVYGEAFLAQLRYPVASINRLAVHPDYRRQGIAGLVDQARLQRARLEGCTVVLAWFTPKSGDHRLIQLREYGFGEIDALGLRRHKFFDQILPLRLELRSPVA